MGAPADGTPRSARTSSASASADVEAGGLHPSASEQQFLAAGMRITFKARAAPPRAALGTAKLTPPPAGCHLLGPVHG